MKYFFLGVIGEPGFDLIFSDDADDLSAASDILVDERLVLLEQATRLKEVEFC